MIQDQQNNNTNREKKNSLWMIVGSIAAIIATFVAVMQLYLSYLESRRELKREEGHKQEVQTETWLQHKLVEIQGNILSLKLNESSAEESAAIKTQMADLVLTHEALVAQILQNGGEVPLMPSALIIALTGTPVPRATPSPTQFRQSSNSVTNDYQSSDDNVTGIEGTVFPTKTRKSIRLIGNLETCVPSGGWIRLYRLEMIITEKGNYQEWKRIDGKGISSSSADGHIKVDGLETNIFYGDKGEPYKIEVVKDNVVIRTIGDILADPPQPPFLIMPKTSINQHDNQTNWPCPYQ